MPSGQHNQTITFDGAGFSNDAAAVSFEHSNKFQINLPVAKGPLTSWVKTDADTAAGDLPAGHGYSTGVFDVYWTSGGGGRRYGVAGTVTSNAIALDGGTGDDFPASSDSTVVCCVQVVIDPMLIDGDEIQIAAIVYRNTVDPTAKGHLDLQDVGDASIAALDLVHEKANGGLQHVYNVAAGDTNAFTGNVIEAGYASNSSLTAAATLFAYFGENT